MFSTRMKIDDFDPALWDAMRAEARRQEEHLELIASENYTSPRVLAAQGSVKECDRVVLFNTAHAQKYGVTAM